MLVTKYRNIDSVPGLERRFNSLSGFIVLNVNLITATDDGRPAELVSGTKGRLVAIRPFLNGQNFDPETERLEGIAFEIARAAVKRPATDEIIDRTIIEPVKAGERNVDVLCDAALHAPARVAPSSSIRRFGVITQKDDNVITQKDDAT